MRTIKLLSVKALFYLFKLRCALSPKKVGTFTLADGARFEYPLNSALGWALTINKFEVGEVTFVLKTLKAGDVFLDIGANGGLFAVIAARQVGTTGHVYAFEPGIREQKLLRRNIAINNISNVTIVEKAVSNTKGVAKFAISKDGAMNSLAATSHPFQQIEEWQSVEVTTLDDFVKETALQRIRFIKIDVEGAEYLVFQGARKLLTSQHPIILFEASEQNASGFSYTVQDFISELGGLGYKVSSLDRAGNFVDISLLNPRVGQEIYNFVAVYENK